MRENVIDDFVAFWQPKPDPVVNPIGLSLPELDHNRHQYIAAPKFLPSFKATCLPQPCGYLPKLWARNVAAFRILLLQLCLPVGQQVSAGYRLALVAAESADSAVVRPRAKVSVGFG